MRHENCAQSMELPNVFHAIGIVLTEKNVPIPG